MTKCPACGAEVDGARHECESCGASLEGTTQSFAPVGLDDVETEADASVVDGPVLVVRKGPEVGERFFVDRPRLTIGRDPSADIFLNDVTVSRKHAVVSVAGDEVSVEDAGSLNGTYVNGLCLDKGLLRNGDVLQIGMFQMVFLSGKGE